MKRTTLTLGSLALALALAACGEKKSDSAAAAPAAGAAPAAAAAAPAAPAGDQEEVVLKFPTAMFIGTPTPTELPNLEKPDPSKVIKSFMAPKGTVNVAAKKKVTSSDAAPIIGDLNLITDGDPDGADGSFVELMPGFQWVQIDLEKSHDIQKVAVWHFHKQAQAYIDVIIQISDDAEFKTGVTTVFNSDHNDDQKMGKGADPAYIETNHGRVIDAKNTKGRYVRLYSAGNTASDMNHYCEVQVFAVPAK